VLRHCRLAERGLLQLSTAVNGEKVDSYSHRVTPSSPSVMVIETGEAAPPVNLRIAVPVFLVIFVVIPGAWDIVRSSCDHHSTLYFVNRGYITGLFGHTYSASTSDGSEIVSFERPSHWRLQAVATARGVVEGMPGSAELVRSNLLDPLHAKWGVRVASLEIGSVNRDTVGFWEPYTTIMGAGQYVLHSSKGWLWGRTFKIESIDGDRRTDKVANTERFLYSEMPLAPVKYRMCIKKGIPGEAVFGILATAVITDIQNSE